MSGLTRLYFAKVMRCEGRRDPVTVQSLENDDCIPQDREQEENTSLKGNHGLKATASSLLLRFKNLI